jgi:hypothetical protein
MMPPPADAHVVGRQQRADGQQRYPQDQVDPAADVILGLDGTDVQHEQIQQPERQPQADPAQQEAHKHHPGPLVPGQDQVNDQQLRVEPANRASPKITSIAARRPCRCTVAVAGRHSLSRRRSSSASPLPPQPWVSPAPRRWARLGPPHCPVAVSPRKESFFIRLARVIAHNGSNGHPLVPRAVLGSHGARSTSTTWGTLIDEIAARAAARGAFHPRQHALDL